MGHPASAADGENALMENNPTPDLADKIAARILECYEVGSYSQFMDEPGGVSSIDEDELAELIREVINGK